MFTLTRGQALNILRKMVGQLGGEGPAFREYWNTLNHFLEAGILTWDDVPKATWENGSKKAKYKFTVPYGGKAKPLCPEIEDKEPGKDTNKKHSIRGIIQSAVKEFLREEIMAEQTDGNLATREQWDINKKLLVADEYHDARESRQADRDDRRSALSQDRDDRRRAAQNQQMLFNQAMNNQQFLFNQALRHEGLIFSRDNFPFDMQGDQEMNEPEDTASS